MKSYSSQTALIIWLVGLMGCETIAQTTPPGLNNLGDTTPAKLENVFSQATAGQNRNTLMTKAEVREKILKSTPRKVWEIVEGGNIFSEKFPSFADYLAVLNLCEIIEVHPLKAQFVDFMLPKIKKLPVPTKEIQKSHNWNEIAIIGHGGLSGLLISSVTKICNLEDCQKIVTVILSTNDATKRAKLRDCIDKSPHKKVFVKLLADK